jgi:hypothetical protein
VISVTSAGQSGFKSDYNDLFTGTAAAAATGRWAGTPQATLAAWRTASAGDAASIGGDPLLLDLDGADNVLGLKVGVSEGDGFDDNLALRKGSPAIDAANGYVAPLLDAQGLPRQDDPARPNVGIGFERFVEADAGASQLAIVGSQVFDTVNLPFTFRFYGTDYTQVRMSRQGFLQFGPRNLDNFDSQNSLEKLKSKPIIAPLWDDFTAFVTGDGTFVDTSVSDQVTFRWKGATVDAQFQKLSDVNVSVTLFKNGTFRFDYGSGNQFLTPTVGVSAGNGATFVASKYDGQASLDGASSVLWNPTPGLTFVDMGAYEFQGRSDDNVPPRVTNILNLPAEGGTTALAFSTIQVSFSESLQSISATSPANFILLEAGLDGNFDTTDDVRIPVVPSYSVPDTNLVLSLTNGALADGRYRLTLSGTNAILDSAGNKLDGNGDGIGGDDFVRSFRIDRSANRAPTAVAQTRSVAEDGSLLVTLSGSDLDGDALTFSLLGAPGHGTLSAFSAAARTVLYTPAANYNGPDAFGFRVDDGKTGVATAQVTLNVTPVNDVPLAASQSVQGAQDVPLLIILGGTDLETPRSGLTFSLVDAPQHGSLVFGASGNWTYSGFDGYAGPDSFSYTVRDGGDPDGTVANRLTSAPATVSITLPAAPGVPQATAQSVSLAEDGSLVIQLGVVVDPGVVPTFSIVAAPGHGTLESFDSASGTVRYRPTANFNGADAFRFRAASGARGSEASVVIDVTPVNDAPVLAAIPAQTVRAGETLSFTATASDVDGDTLRFELLDAPAGATLSAAGSFVWKPTPGQVSAVPYLPHIVVHDGGTPELTDEKAASITVQPGVTTFLGDANGDGAVNFSDLAVIKSQLFRSGPGLSGDLSGDGVVNFSDLAILKANIFRLTPRITGDINSDGNVNFADLAILKSQFLKVGSGLSADLNHDGAVNFADLSLLKKNFLKSSRAPGVAPVLPEAPLAAAAASLAPGAAGLPTPTSIPVDANVSARAVLGLDVSIGAGVRVEADARIGAGAVIGEGSTIRRGARLGARARLGRGVVVERGAEVPDGAVVLDGSVVRAAAHSRSRIGAGSSRIGLRSPQH